MTVIRCLLTLRKLVLLETTSFVLYCLPLTSRIDAFAFFALLAFMVCNSTALMSLFLVGIQVFIMVYSCLVNIWQIP